MDKYVLVKQLLYTNYDKVRFDSQTLNDSIKLIENINSNNNSIEVINILKLTYDKLFQNNIKEIILKIINFIKYDSNYGISKVISNLKIMYEDTLKKKVQFLYYINLVENV